MRYKILIIYDYFFPAYKAGGITQSLFNMYSVLKQEFEVNVICSNFDLTGELLVSTEKLEDVKYVKKNSIIKELYLMSNEKLDFVYLNGIFSPFYFFLPLIYFQLFKPKVKIVVAPRGMMQEGALEIKSFKKKLFLTILLKMGLFKNVLWHATDNQELLDIRKIVGPNAKCKIALNIPKAPDENIRFIEKSNTILKIIFLSLVTEKKNLHLIIQSLQSYKLKIIFDIYGPIKDIDYWSTCQDLIKKLPANVVVSYKGAIKPKLVQNTIVNYHALILPSKGENFGHAIYEAFSVGRPVIISHFTPWVDLNQSKCGWNVNLDLLDINNAIENLDSLNQVDFNEYCFNANGLAKKYYSSSSDLGNAISLFKH